MSRHNNVTCTSGGAGAEIRTDEENGNLRLKTET